MAMTRHFSLDRAGLVRTRAHGGDGLILTQRVLDARGSKAINFIDMTIVPPGGDIGEHTHTEDNEEIYIFLSGSGMMVVDGERFVVESGDVVVNRPGGTHGFWNTGASEVRLVVVEVPVRSLIGEAVPAGEPSHEAESDLTGSPGGPEEPFPG